MLRKVILKNFRINIKNYILFFISEIVAIALLFSLLALRECLFEGIKDEMIRYMLEVEFKIASTVMLIITVLMLFFSMKYYMKSRMKDYSMFLMLGMRRRILYLMMLAEYSIGWLCSACAGLILGRGLVAGCQVILKKVDVTYGITYSICVRTYRITLAVSLAVMAVAFVALMVILEERDLSQLLNEEKKKEIRPVSKWWIIMITLGIGLYVYAFHQYYTTDAGITYAVMQWIVSGFLILSFGGSFVLKAIKGIKSIYYKRVLQINQYYYRYNSNVLFICMMFIIHFLIMGYMSCSIIENLPLQNNRNQYPYDYIWIGQEKDEEYAEEFAEKAKGEYYSYPMIRLASWSGSEHIGISESVYEELTGYSLQLDDNEIYLVIEMTPDDDIEIIDREGYESNFQGVHTGKYRNEMYNVLLDSEEFNSTFNKYKIREIKRETLWGSVSMDNYHENTVVFSDKRFQEERNTILHEADEPNELFLFKIPKTQREEVGEKLTRYVEEYGIEDEHTNYEQNVLYDMDQILEANLKRNLFNIISKGFIIAAFCISGLFIIGMKVFSDIPQYIKKYEYLNCMGMRRKEERKYIGKEVKNMLHLSLATGLFYGVTYLYVTVKMGDMSTARQEHFIKYWVIIIVVYLIVQFILENILAGVLIKRIERGISDESH